MILNQTIDDILAIYKRIDRGEIEDEEQARKEIEKALLGDHASGIRGYLPERGTDGWNRMIEDALSQVIAAEMKTWAKIEKLTEATGGLVGPAATTCPMSTQDHIETLYAAINRLERKVAQVEGKCESTT